MWLSRQGTCSHVIFSDVTLRKTWAMWTPFWGPPNCFSLRGPQNGVQILGPILRSTLPVFFLAAWRWKRSSSSRMLVSRMLVSRFVFFTPHCWNWDAFLTSFWGPQANGFIQERGVVAGTRLAWSSWFLFFLQLWLLYFLLSWSFFRALSWLQFCAWTRVGFLRGRLVFFSCCCFGWRFRCFLGCCFGFCFCEVGGLAPGLVLAWSFQFLLVTILVFIFCIWWNIDDCQTILTFQHVISSLRVYASAILNKVRSRYVSRLLGPPASLGVSWAWQRDCRLASRRHSSCLATALRSVPVNDPSPESDVV